MFAAWIQEIKTLVQLYAAKSAIRFIQRKECFHARYVNPTEGIKTEERSHYGIQKAHMLQQVKSFRKMAIQLGILYHLERECRRPRF